jgi:hypothetical protein
MYIYTHQQAPLDPLIDWIVVPVTKGSNLEYEYILPTKASSTSPGIVRTNIGPESGKKRLWLIEKDLIRFFLPPSDLQGSGRYPGQNLIIFNWPLTQLASLHPSCCLFIKRPVKERIALEGQPVNTRSCSHNDTLSRCNTNVCISTLVHPPSSSTKEPCHLTISVFNYAI